jgi:hypothetical protein
VTPGCCAPQVPRQFEWSEAISTCTNDLGDYRHRGADECSLCWGVPGMSMASTNAAVRAKATRMSILPYRHHGVHKRFRQAK